MTQWHHINLWNQQLVCYPILKVEGGNPKSSPTSNVEMESIVAKRFEADVGTIYPLANMAVEIPSTNDRLGHWHISLLDGAH